MFRVIFDFIIHRHLVRGALGLFEWASTQGFIGVGFYFFLWVTIFPLMFVASNIFGITIYLDEERFRKKQEEVRRFIESDVSYKDEMTDFEKRRGY